MKHIEITEAEWENIRQQIREEFGTTMVLIRSRMQRELGFTPRNHMIWKQGKMSFYPTSVVHIDFYNEEAKIWFTLKYL